MADHPIDLNSINGDSIGTDVSGVGNLIGKDIHYTVKGNVFNINSPSNDFIEALKKILLVQTEEESIDKHSGVKNPSTIRDLRLIEKNIQQILDLLKITDVQIGTTTREVKAGEIRISRVNLLLKRSIVLIEQANKYWNVVSKNSDINMYRTKLKEANRHLQEANLIDQYNTEVLLYMAKVQGKLMPNNPVNMRQILFRIKNLLDFPHSNIEKFHLAHSIFLLAITEKPIDDNSIQDAREMFKELGRKDWLRQCDDLLQPEETQTKSAKSLYKKGLVLGSLGRYDQAIECFDKALEIDANDSRIWNGKGYIFGNLGRYQEAIECFDKALEIDTNNNSLAILKNKGTALHYLGRYDQAIECFDKVLKIDSTDGDTWSGIGISFDYLGRYDQAIECFDKAISTNPKSDDAWYNKGVALDYLRKYEEAITCYDKAIDMNPDNGIAWHGKSLCLGGLGDHKEADSCMDKARRLGLNA